MSKITQKAIYKLLVNDATLTNIVGTKIYPTFFPEDTKMPAVTYRITEKVPQRSKDATHGSDETLLVQIFSKKAEEIQNIAQAIIDVLDRYSGTVTVENGTESITIKRMTYEGEADEPFAPELLLFHLALNFRVQVQY